MEIYLIISDKIPILRDSFAGKDTIPGVDDRTLNVNPMTNGDF